MCSMVLEECASLEIIMLGDAKEVLSIRVRGYHGEANGAEVPDTNCDGCRRPRKRQL